jgi:hypothetical protein
VSVGVGLTSEQTFLKVYTAYTTSSLQITAPPSSQLNFTTITFDIPTMAETVMPIIIVAALIIAVAAFLVERRVTRSTRQAKGRKR